MIKKLLVFSVFVIISLFLPIPSYVELNDLAIINGVGVSCEQEEVTLYLKEVIPVKAEQGIEYQYHYYQSSGKDIQLAYEKLNSKIKKKLYLNKTKFLLTNCKTTESIINELHLKDVKIYHNNENILKEVKKIN